MAAAECHNRVQSWRPRYTNRELYFAVYGQYLVDFVGYITFADYKLLRKRSKRSLERIKREKDPERQQQRLAAWKGHADHANSYHYQQNHVGGMLK